LLHPSFKTGRSCRAKIPAPVICGIKAAASPPGDLVAPFGQLRCEAPSTREKRVVRGR
jgi:hypothetical protein